MPVMEPQESPRRRWFRQRTFGYGWTPITWEGWLVTLVLTLSPIPILVLTHASLLGVGLVLLVVLIGFLFVAALTSWQGDS